MADNFTANPGSGGSQFAADDIGSGLLLPRVKPAWGADGTGVDASVAAPLPVQATPENGQIAVAGVLVTPKFAKIAASSSGDNTIVAAVTGKKLRVLAVNFIANGTVNGKFQSGAAGTDLTGLYYMVANAGAALACPQGLFETASGALLNLNLSAAVAVGGCLTYIEV